MDPQTLNSTSTNQGNQNQSNEETGSPEEEQAACTKETNKFEDAEVFLLTSQAAGTPRPQKKSMQSQLLVQKPLDPKIINRAVGYFIAIDCMPYNIVERSGFKNLMSILQPMYKLPARKSISDSILPKLYSETKDSVMKLLSSAGFYSLTTDCWTSTVMDQYICLTVHFTTPDWELQSITLHCRHLPGSHTFDVILEAVRSMLEEWNLRWENLVSATTDNGTNVVKAMATAKVDRIPCLGHVINIGINRVMEKEFVKTALTDVRKVQTLIAHSAIWREKLHKVQAELNLPTETFPAAVATRWWTTLKLVQRYLKHRLALTALFQETRSHRHLVPNMENIEVLEALVEVLVPLENATTYLGGEKYVTASAVTPILYQMLEDLRSYETAKDSIEQSSEACDSSEHSLRLNVNEESSEQQYSQTLFSLSLSQNIDPYQSDEMGSQQTQVSIFDMKKVISETVSVTILKYYKVPKICSIIHLATVLDPRFRFQYFTGMSQEEISTIKKTLKKEAIEICRISNAPSHPPENCNIDRASTSSAADDCEPPPPKKLTGLEAILRKPKSKGIESDREGAFSQSFDKELESYLQMADVELNSNTLEWWRNHILDFPRLAKMARKYLCITATSVPSERVFSCGGRVISDTRGCITPEHAEQQIFLCMNKHLVSKVGRITGKY